VTELNRTAILAAADWLEKNPDKHIAVELARTAQGHRCLPNDPNATCFCALGRIAVEMGFELSPYSRSQLGDIGTAAGLSSPQLGAIWVANDANCATHKGSSGVIPLLRSIAA
jgi:hypothetical protein